MVIEDLMKKTGDILCHIRQEKGVSQEQLCQGLCTKGTYSKYEYGMLLPDCLLMQAVLQRLGKAADKLVRLLVQEEYNYFQWKREVLTAAGQEDMAELVRLLAEPEAVSIVINQKLQQQFVYRMQAIAADRKDQDTAKSIQYLKEAAELTMPGICREWSDKYWISVEEMHILLELAEELLKEEREEEAAKLLGHICKYADGHYDDYEAKVKVFPRAVNLLWPLLQKGQELEGMLLCKKAVELLCWQGILYDLSELMRGYLVCGRNLSSAEETIRYRKQLDALLEMYQEYSQESRGLSHSRLFYQNQEIYLIGEMIQRYRSQKSISQEQLSEEICAPETLSRIESGKRSPSRKHFYALMDKLDTRHSYYNGRLDTDDFHLLEKYKELERALALKNLPEARRLMEELKAEIPMENEQNRRSLEITENQILFAEKQLSPDEYIARCEKALNCEEGAWRKEEFWKQFFTKDKVRVLNGINLALEKKSRREDGIFILEHLLEQFEQSKVHLADRYGSSMLIVVNLSCCYGEQGNLEKCLEMCEKGIKLCFESGRGVRLSKLLGNKAEALHITANASEEKCRRYFEWAYYLGDLMEIRQSTAYIDSYYRKHYDPDVVWY